MTPTRRCILGVFAHPDDETSCAGGTFSRYASVRERQESTMALQSDVDGLQQRRADKTPTRADGGWGGSVAAHPWQERTGQLDRQV